MRKVFVCVLLQCLVLSAFAGVFENVDSNGNGVIEKEEFTSFLNSLQQKMIDLNNYLDTTNTAVTSESSTTLYGSYLLLLNSGTSLVQAFFKSFFVIVATEIGDKTFFIAAILAMRNARIVVYLGSMLALAAMHILSCLMGFALPNLLPRKYTHIASIFLFVYFGLKLLKDSTEMKSDGPSDELHEVEEELVGKKMDEYEGDEEAGADKKDKTIKQTGGDDDKKSHGANGWSSANVSVFMQALTLTFVAEWGDRSQIATIALSSSLPLLGVLAGGLLGHALCTGLAVAGGRLMAARISEKTVAVAGGLLFLIFALHSYIYDSV